jgi:hypothetical protein
MGAWVPIVGLANELGIIKGLRDKLLRQDTPAAAKLAEVLDELARMVSAVDDEIVRYLALHFEPAALASGRAVLLGLEAGQSRVRMGEARGHCHKIGNIYRAYLQRWFASVLDPGEAQQMEYVFDRLSTADSEMLATMDAVTDWLQREAAQTLDLVDADDLVGANKSIRDARRLIRADRERLMQAMADLRTMQGQFIAASGTV